MSDLGMGEDQGKIDALEHALEENLSAFFSEGSYTSSIIKRGAELILAMFQLIQAPADGDRQLGISEHLVGREDMLPCAAMRGIMSVSAWLPRCRARWLATSWRWRARCKL